MDLEVSGLKGYPGIGGAVGFAKGIAAKAHHHVPDFGDLVIGHPALLGAAVKPLLKVAQLVFAILFGQDFAQGIGFGMGKAGDHHRRAGNVFLIDHDAEGFSEHFGQKGMNRVPGTAVQAANVFLDKFVGGRADNAAVDDEVLEIAHPGFLLQQPHGRAFDVEAAHGAALGQGLLGGKIVFRLPAQLVKGDAVVV